MGKLLLQGKNKKTSLNNEKGLKQQVLTDEPFAGLFRVRKSRVEQPTNSPVNTKEIKFSLKKDKAQESTNLSPFQKYRLVDGRKTRWDIRDPSVVQQTDVEKVLKEDIVEDLSDEEDANSVNTLQSDDDVLGPWIELGMIDPTTLKAPKVDLSIDVCQQCSSNSQNRSPLDKVKICDQCSTEWSPLFRSLLTKIVDSLAESKKAKTSKLNKASNAKKTTIKTGNQLNGNRRKVIIPPTKSKHFQRTNKKIMAAKKNNVVTSKDVSSKKKPVTADVVEHITTGAFLTRKTAHTLADPEYGFYPNPYGLLHQQRVEVLNINGYWYPGILEMMDKGKVKVKYLDWDDQEEWIIMGSRRLRVAVEEGSTKMQNEKKEIVENMIDIVNTSALNAFVSDNKKKTNNEDYVSHTLDKDPNHIFNDNEVFMTRRMARELVDEYGFKPNAFGYRRNRAVMITSFGSKKKREEYVGYLREMNQDQVRVWYPSILLSEWLPVGSRRIRIMTEKEQVDLVNDKVDLDTQNATSQIASASLPESITSNQENITDSTRNKSVATAITKAVSSSASTENINTPALTVTDNIVSSACALNEENNKNQCTEEDTFLTTGAFATRRAMRQLKDENGFTPNPYGYTYNMTVEVLNTRSGKSKFWERGTLVAMRQGQVKVHYEGWADIYDEWIMVGSRRIRTATLLQDEESVQLASCPSSTAAPLDAELLMPEANPEIREEAKKSRKHQIVRPQDYQEMGLLVSLEELAEKEAKKRERSGNDSQTEYMPVRRQKKKARTRKSSLGYKKKQQQESTDVDYCALQSEEAQQIISLRLAHAKASGKNQFIANVYGYDYMQHVTVLHLDKKVYEGRLVSIEKNKVRVHYCGWLDAFDEYIALGSRRIQPIENDHEVVCLEPGYQERFESSDYMPGNTMSVVIPCRCCQENQKNQKPSTVNRFSRKRLTLENTILGEDSDDNSVEYHKETIDTDEEELVETENWKVYCNQCNIVIKQFRYYCTYCETPSLGYDYQSFELCLRCFDQNFPFWHEHPRSSFAIQAVIDSEVGPKPIKGELVTIWEEDILDETPSEISPAINQEIKDSMSIDASKIFTGSAPITIDQGYKYLKKWRRRKVCAFCNDDDDTSEDLGAFIGPFIIAIFNKNGVEKKKSFWAHDSCARYSPEVFCTPEGKWYNVTLALRRGRGMRCHVCKEKGATIGCFESKCSRSFHLPCTQKPVNYFRNGVIFWCGIHEAYYNKIDTYVNIFNCDGCSKELADESWFTCVPCSQSYFSSFDLCSECFEKFPKDHSHNEDEFEETSFAIIKEMEAQKATAAAREKEERRLTNIKKRKKPLFPKRRRKLANGSIPVSCCYCGTYESDSWRKGYEGGVIMCNKCFELALLIDNDGEPLPDDMPLVTENDNDQHQQIMQQNQLQNRYVASIEDYSHKPYLTRDALSSTKFSESTTGTRLATYEPQPNQLFSLIFESTYFDIPGRAPRWATHSGTDYHGTWLPQTVRRAILKYTTKDERVLSNFLGRGTDAIECFLLQRKCCGVDINPSAVTLSQRNCCFEIPPGLTSAEYRPIIAQADSRNLSGALFTDESYHHILSHPPYKDCVAYSTHLEGDLSRFTNVEDFKMEYTKVVKESWRLLKMSRRLTLGIGDNREHCFYIPVSFQLIRLYIDHGFELEELIIKRQRYCSAFGLGTYLCVQFDFLVFTHEFIATFKKIPAENINRMLIDYHSKVIEIKRTLRGIPSSAILRKSRVMGTVWIFKPTTNYSLPQLCVSRMVERFGQDDSNWVHVELTNGFAVIKVIKKNETIEESEENKISMSEYEQERLKRIQENNKTLLKLGLISELSEESEDVIHHDTMISKEPYNEGKLMLMVTGHVETLQPNQINEYRKTLVSLANEATVKLATKGMLIIGTKDVRDPITGKLWPLTMLVLEDIERVLGRDIIRLKEMVVTVPDGYSKDRKNEYELVEEQEEDFIDIETIEHDHLPIVHAVYLIFQKI
ncbi:MAG: hypothetical protein EXX96DRAFT_491184 [Benjaminiella poitrasii]|nr:MAG: hypothetical protein EXX96DRAFT_491184 [Benjaminiella poitrasii]